MIELPAKSLTALFFASAAQRKDAPFQGWREESGWRTRSWDETAVLVRELGLGLLSLGVEPQQRVALFAPNSPAWGLADLAILALGAVDVPIYATNSAEEAQYVLAHSESRVCFAAPGDQLQRILEVRAELPALVHLICLGAAPEPRPEGILTLDEVLAKGRAAASPEDFDAALAKVQPEDLATLIYTSGTTGPPKGVMLTHKNFLVNVEQALISHPGLFVAGDTSLSFLPLSHCLERTAGWYLMIRAGCTVYYARSPLTVVDDLKDIRPNFAISVPRLFEKMHAAVREKVAHAPALRQRIFAWSLDTARGCLPYTTLRRPLPLHLRVPHALAMKLVGNKLAAALGLDRIKVMVSGGGPLAGEINEFFHSVGVTVHEGYGLTETTPVATVNTFEHFGFGTVGAAVADTEVRLAEDGEILIRGPQVMAGYWKNEAATEEMIDSEGWLHSGDIGVFDGPLLRITDRKKDLIITAGGKNVAPQNIENSLVMDRYVDKVAVVGDRRPYLVALIVPAFEALESWAEEQGLSAPDRAALVALPEVRALFEERVKAFNETVGRVEQIKRFALMDHEFSQATGELTPTLKLKRKVVQQMYEAVVESLYRDSKKAE